MSKQLNIFINSNDFGQTMSAVFDLSIQGTLGAKRLTDQSNCKVCESIYEKEISDSELLNLIKSSAVKAQKRAKAMKIETVRVNALNALVKELVFVSQLGDEYNNEAVTIFVPWMLCDEIQNGKVKYYINNSDTESSYYSAEELELWGHFFNIYSSMCSRVIFRNLNLLIQKSNPTEEEIKRENIAMSNMSDEFRVLNNTRKIITASLNKKLTEAFIEERKRREENPKAVEEEEIESLDAWC